MQATEFCVDDLIYSPEIIFGDSEGVASDEYSSGNLPKQAWEEMIGNPTSVEMKEYTLEYKLSECSQEFLDSIEKDGIKNPVAMLGNTIMDGHHRLAAAQFLGIKVPVMVYDDWEEFENKHYWEIPNTCHSDGEVFTEYL